MNVLGLPWPNPFPDWKGVSVLKLDSFKWGHGLDVRMQEYTDFEWHPDAGKYPDLMRMKLGITFVSVPDDAPESDKLEIGNKTVIHRYYKVDRERKSFQLVGTTLIPDETTTTNPDMFEINGQRLSDPHGEWQWHTVTVSTNLQHALNADNTVMREVNFGAPVVKETGDWSKACKFNLAVPPHKDLIASKITPPPPDFIDEKLDEIKAYFTADDSMYRSPVEKSKRQVNVACKFNQVTAVDTPQERFGANLTLTLTWQITKDDVVGYVAAPDQDAWKPAYTPPEFAVKNPASGDGAALIISKYSNIQLIKTKKAYMAMQTLTVSGDFWEPFELQNYPFDIQPLGVVLESTNAQLDNLIFKCSVGDLPELRDTEWSGKGASADAKFAVDEGKKKRGRYTLSVEAVAQRYYSVHMYRVVAVMALFSLGSIVSMCSDPDVNALERIGITFTLMLTATAYSLVIASGLPTLGYLTFLDKYILATFGFIALVGAEITVIDWVADRYSSNPLEPLYDAADAIEYAAFVDLGLWFVIHIGLYLYISRSVLPAERKKVDREAVKAKKKAEKKKAAEKAKGKKDKVEKPKAVSSADNYAI